MSAAGVRVRLGVSMAEVWMSVAPCLMWKPLSATYVISCAPVPLLPAFVGPGESSGNTCLFYPPGTSHLGYVARCTRPVFAQITRNCGDTFAMTVPWSAGIVASKTETKDTQVHDYRNLALRILRRSSTFGDSVLYEIYHKLPISQH